MMFAKTFCKPGSYVEVAPIGLQAMLEYNKNGLLQKVKLLEPVDNGVSFCKEVDSEILNAIYSIVPTSIKLKDGTTWVEGTFFTKNLPAASHGKIAWCAQDEYIAMLRRGVQFEFYAGNVRSLAASFKGALTVRNWLMSSGFKVLPGIVIPVEMKQDALNMLFTTAHLDFYPEFIAAFYVFEGTSEAKFKVTELYYNNVEKCDMILASDGYIKGVMTLDSTEELTVNYSDACFNSCNYAPNVHILYEKLPDGSVHLLKGVTLNPVSRLSVYTCPVCHAKVIIPPTGPCQCSDPNCLSRLYPDCCKMLRRLSLPELPYEQYKKFVEDKTIICLTDVLNTDNYKNTRPEVSLAEALSAITPVEVVSDISFFERFANSCGSTLDSMLYYLKNPTRIRTELRMNDLQCERFITWISDPYNLTSVTTLFSCVELKARSQQFDVAPIFRNNTFVLTGKFKRGSYKDIASILESYQAKVLPDIVNTEVVNAVIIGGTDEDISGHIIKTARACNIPTVEEDTFFSMYDIDADIASNLL